MIPFLYKLDDLYTYIQCTEKSDRRSKNVTFGQFCREGMSRRRFFYVRVLTTEYKLMVAREEGWRDGFNR